MNNQVSNWCIIKGELQSLNVQIDFLVPPVYEVIRLIEGTPLFFNAHMLRFRESLLLSKIEGALEVSKILEGISALVAHTGLTHHNVRLEMGETISGITWVLFMVETYYPEQSAYTNGVHAVTSNLTRENPHAKIFRKQYAETISKIRSETGAFEVILTDDTGRITEGSRSNLFFIKNNTVITAKEEDVLLGISQLELCKLLKKLSVGFEMRDVQKAELPNFEACFLTGTSIKVLPVASIDSYTYASGSHPLLLKLIEAFDVVLKKDISCLKQNE